MAKVPTGYIVYQGPSMLDGNKIVVVALTKKSTNRKTGDIVQTYILVDNGQSPQANASSLADASICGACPHRHGTGGACYVNLGHGPARIYDGIARGIYPFSVSDASTACDGRMVRLGTYGDPAAVPRYVWDALLLNANGHTGYTHQWKTGKSDAVMEYCMASADTKEERVLAKSLGFRTFRVMSDKEQLQIGEFSCPASEEQGKRKTCAECGACSGGVNSRKADPAIVVHGGLKKRFIAINPA